MKTIKQNRTSIFSIPFILFAGVLLSLSFSPEVKADATFPVYDESHFPPFAMNRLNFRNGVPGLPQPTEIADSSTPEGRNVIFTPAIPGEWQGWGFANVPETGSFNVIERSYEEYAGGDLRFLLRSRTPLVVKVQYGGVVRDPEYPVPSTDGQWQEVVIPLSELGATPERLRRVRYPFILVDDRRLDIPRQSFVDHVRWTKPVTRLVMIPQGNTQMNPFQSRQFTVEGRDSAGEHVAVYPTFTNTIGTLNVTDQPARSVVLTVDDTLIRGQVRAFVDNLATLAGVEVSTGDLNGQFGVLSETIPGMELGSDNPRQNSQLFLYSENSANINSLPVLTPVADNAPEGTEFFKMTFLPKTINEHFQGMALSWGVNTPNENAFDGRHYHQGAIKFWFKGPSGNAELASKLRVGIRSINVPAGRETSSVLLRDFAPFDNRWHAVTVPLSVLAGGAPFADLSRSKILFNIAVAGRLRDTGDVEDRTICIDNIRWDTVSAGPVTRIQIDSAADPSAVPAQIFNRFIATGFDAQDRPVDVFPEWSSNGNIGQFLKTEGPRVFFAAANQPGSGSVQATLGNTTARLNVTVANVSFPERFDIYSDGNSAGNIIADTGPEQSETTTIQLESLRGGAADDPAEYLSATVTLDDTAEGENDSFAFWASVQSGIGRYLANYGILKFDIRSNHNLEFGMQSTEVDADANRAKLTLDELGIPRSNPGSGAWQRILIPLSLFQEREPNHNMGSISTYFLIAATSRLIGEVTDMKFDIDNVELLSTGDTTPDFDKVYQGLKEKQLSSGLVRSFSDIRANLYDQALAAMAFCLKGDTMRAVAIFNAYISNYSAAEGFPEILDVEFPIQDINSDRFSGPNAYFLLAMIYHKESTGSTEFDGAIRDLATWIRGKQDRDGAVFFGEAMNENDGNAKSTEHNLAVYAAFRAYARVMGDDSYNTSANNILAWLESDTGAWNPFENRFNVGIDPSGEQSFRKALDIYSLPVLAIGRDSSIPFETIEALLPLAENTFAAEFPATVNGNIITGLDFGAPPEVDIDNDGVWMEGMAQMGAANAVLGNEERRNFYLAQIEKTIFPVSPTTQGIPYASNPGTAFNGAIMNPVDPAVSAMVWAMFANEGFNPFLRSQDAVVVDAGEPQIKTDTIGNGSVGFADFVALSLAFNSSPPSYPPADTNGDNRVDFADFVTLSLNFGKIVSENPEAAISDSEGWGEETFTLAGVIPAGTNGTARWIFNGETFPGQIVDVTLPIPADRQSITFTAIFEFEHAGGVARDQVQLTLNEWPGHSVGAGVAAAASLSGRSAQMQALRQVKSQSIFFVDAGENQDVPMETVERDRKIGMATLAGQSPGAEEVLWFYIDCAQDPCGTVSIHEPRSLTTSVNFSQPGVYSFGLGATDKKSLGLDFVTVRVDANGIIIRPGPGPGTPTDRNSGANSNVSLKTLFNPEQNEQGDILFHIGSTAGVQPASSGSNGSGNETVHVRVLVVDRSGRVICHVVSKLYGQGSHIVQWDGKDDAGNVVPAGTYHVISQVGSDVQKSKVVVTE